MKRTDKMLLGGLGVLGAGAVAYILFRSKKADAAPDPWQTPAQEAQQADQEASLKVSATSTKIIRTKPTKSQRDRGIKAKDMVAIDWPKWQAARKAAKAVTTGRKVPVSGSADRLDTWVAALQVRTDDIASGAAADCKAQGGIAKRVYPPEWENAVSELNIWHMHNINKSPCPVFSNPQWGGDPKDAAQWMKPTEYSKRGSCIPPDAWAKVAMVDAGLKQGGLQIECIPGRGGTRGLEGIGNYIVSPGGW